MVEHARLLFEGLNKRYCDLTQSYEHKSVEERIHLEHEVGETYRDLREIEMRLLKAEIQLEIELANEALAKSDVLETLKHCYLASKNLNKLIGKTEDRGQTDLLQIQLESVKKIIKAGLECDALVVERVLQSALKYKELLSIQIQDGALGDRLNQLRASLEEISWVIDEVSPYIQS